MAGEDGGKGKIENKLNKNNHLTALHQKVDLSIRWIKIMPSKGEIICFLLFFSNCLCLILLGLNGQPVKLSLRQTKLVSG